MVSNDIALLSDWSVTTLLASDHLPILITINYEQFTIDGLSCTCINFKQADWAVHADTSEKYLADASETRTVEQAEKTFMKAMSKARSLLIPADRIPHFKPILPASAKSLADERERIHGLNPADVTLTDITKLIKKLVMEDKRTKLQSTVDKYDH